MTSSADQEVQLARQMLTGDVDAFEAFVEIFRRRLYQYSFLTCGQKEDAEEVAQETLLKVFQNLTSLREPDRVRTWVFRIAKNACLMKRRRSMYAPGEEISVEDSGREFSDQSPLPDELFFQGEMSEALTSGIQSLPPDYRAVVLLRDVEELTTEEAAHVLEISTDLVKQRLHRARLALRKYLIAEMDPKTIRARAGVLNA